MGEIGDLAEGAGTLAEGSAAARAVEPQNGPAAQDDSGGHFQESACLNCGTALAGAYCHACGQQAHLHKTAGAFLHDLLHGVLHFEGKTWRTLPMLAWRPGSLTRDYIEGHRARYVSPMALFLFSIFLMFAVFQAAGIGPPADIKAPTPTPEQARQMEEAKGSIAQQQRELEERLARLPEDDPQRDDIESELAGIRAGSSLVTLAEGAEGGWRLTTVRTGRPFIDHIAEKWQANPALMLYKLQANSYKFSWLLIPLSLPFVALLFAWRRRFGLYDHAVFVTYSLSFMTLLFVAVTLLQLAGVPWSVMGWAVALLPPLHLYRHLRGAYRLSRFSTLWRLAVLALFILLILVVFLNLLVLLGAF